ncbi:MAG: glycosyltransferase, partial [Alkalinema sp. CAN_BIN05]|nr:glycosyltransferase [Alkalinema sp. CAN_BIN05]
MHITILTYGSRGDIQPFVALGVELLRSGHQVR